MKFMSEDFMLRDSVAKDIFEAIKDEPIYDYHCHLSPKEIYENKDFEDVTDVWLGGDHYKWRLLRANGIVEDKITGKASKQEKFEAWIETLSEAYGNPLYHWSHLELYRIFGIEEAVSADQWESLYQRMNTYIQTAQLSPRKLIEKANVAFIGTTDNPLDDLVYHQQLKEDQTFMTIVAPTFRPDEVFVEHLNFSKFIERLAELTNRSVTNYAELLIALEDRVHYFVENGCRASDHSLTNVEFVYADREQLDGIFTKALKQQPLTQEEVVAWQTMIMVDLCDLYRQYDLVTQIHFGALRSQNTRMLKGVGPDSGFDSMKDQADVAVALNQFLDYLTVTDRLPKMVFYNLNPTYNDLIANTLANFQANEEGIKSPLQFGAAWWFADTERGMLKQLDALADQGMLANFIGMLTDSRSFLSYQRHDYFRRILANYIAKWVDEGKVPADMQNLKEFAKRIAYRNAYDYFGERKENQ